MNKQNFTCDNCRFCDTVHDGTGKNGYCWYHYKSVAKSAKICKKFELSLVEERIVASGDSVRDRAYSFANIRKRKEREFRDLALRLIEIGLLAALVLATIYFGVQN